MPKLAEFAGIVVVMFHFDDDRHHRPHIHVRYQGKKAVVTIDAVEVLAGKLPKKQRRRVVEWVREHRDDLLACWDLALLGEPLPKVPILLPQD